MKKVIIAISFVLVVILAVVGILATKKSEEKEEVEAGWEIVEQPTCETAGIKKHTDKNGKTTTESIEPLGHDYATSKKDPTCTVDGFTVYDCTRCESKYVSDFENALGHEFGEWTINTSVTCTTNGNEIQACSRCEMSNTRLIVAAGHQYDLIRTETVDSVEYTVYECQQCQNQERLKPGETLVEYVENEQIFDVSEDFSFIVNTDNDEEYIRENLSIIDAYFSGSEFEYYDEVKAAYTLEKLDNLGNWRVSPSTEYEYSLTYVAKLSGDLTFSEHNGSELTFTVCDDENHENVLECNDSIVYLQALENNSPGYYPYVITMPEESENMYVTVGKADGLIIGQVICVGNVASADEITAEAECCFGKITDIYTLQSGEKMLVLSKPRIEEVFSNLDISYNQPIDFDSVDVNIEAVENELINALYSNDDFVEFIGAVKVATTKYIQENDLDSTAVVSIKSFMDMVKITPSISFDGEKLKGKLEGKIDVPLKNPNKEDIGSINVSFVLDIESKFVLDINYSVKTLLLIPYELEYLDLQIRQTDNVKFNFDVKIDVDYSLEAGRYLQNTESGKIHRRGCVHISQIKDKSKIKNMSVIAAEKAISENASLECKHCKPTSGFQSDILVINRDTSVIHAYNCVHTAQISDSNKLLSTEKAAYWILNGYTCCDWCHPDNREEIAYKSLVESSLEHSDWQQLTTDISKWAQDSGFEKLEDKNVNIVTLSVPIYGFIQAEIDIDFVLNLDIEASLSYEFEYTQQTRYGIRYHYGRVSTYTGKASKVISNDLNFVGKADFRAGLSFDLNLNIMGLSKWARVGVCADIGFYANLSGVLNWSGVTEENYAAAYFEAGIYLSIEAYYKLFDLNDRKTIYDLEVPLIVMGYDKAYFAYVNQIETLDVDGAYDINQLLEVKCFDLKELKTSQEWLNVLEENDAYTISIELKDGTYFSIQNGQIIESADAPCIFSDTLTISITGNGDWKDFRKNSAVFYLREYTIELNGTSDSHDEIDHICQLCGKKVSYCEDEDDNNYCDVCGIQIVPCHDDDTDHECDDCGRPMGEHSDPDGDGDHNCDYCSENMTDCVDSNFDRTCEECGGFVKQPSQGLEYTLSSDGTYYIVSGMGTCADSYVVIPSTHENLPVKEIGKKAFYGQGGISAVELSNEITVIGDEAFYLCTYLSVATLSDEIIYIGSNAFYNCESLTSITISSNLVSVASDAFVGCKSLYVVRNNSDILFEIGSTNDGRVALNSKILIQNGEVSYSNDGYEYMLTEGDFLFRYKENVYELIAYCGTSTTVTLPLSINGSVYNIYEMRGAVNVIVPTGITSISAHAFSDCIELRTIKLSDGVISIGESAFDGCINLEDIELPDSITSLGRYVFRSCESFESIKLPNGITEISSDAFSACYGLVSVEIPSGVKRIGAYAFRYCFKLKTIEIPDGVLTIGNYAFSSCKMLTSVTIPDSVHTIGSSAFEACVGLTSVTIGKGVRTIDRSAFYDCDYLYFVRNESELTFSIDTTEDGFVARYAKVLMEKGKLSYARDGYEYILTQDYFLFRYKNEKYQMIAYCGNEDTVTLPESINGNTYELYEMKGLRNVIIPEGATSVGKSAFRGCIGLVSVKIPSSVVTIEQGAFYNCTGLESIEIPNSVTTLGVESFYRCTSLTSVTIPDSVITVCTNAFYGCEKLSEISIGKNVTTIGSAAFRGTKITSIFIPDSVTTLGPNVFQSCSQLTSVTFENTEGWYYMYDEDSYAFVAYVTDSERIAKEMKENYRTYYLHRKW